MPKLDDTHLPSRLAKRIEQLKRGDEVPTKDIRAVLNEQQKAALEAAWTGQQALRKQKRARTTAEQQALGWKSKREVQIEFLEGALAEAKSRQQSAYEHKLLKATVRQARIYFNSLNASAEKGIIGQQARNTANNDLTRAGLRRMDGQKVGYASKRDAQIAEMEELLMKQFEAEMTVEEREQKAFLQQSKGVEARPTAKSRRVKKVR